VRRFNLLADEPVQSSARVGEAVGGMQIAASLYDLEDGQSSAPSHFHHGIEEWVIALAGAPHVHTAAGEQTLAEGDVVCFPAGLRGLHEVTGPGRVLIVSDTRDLDVVELPDRGELIVQPPGTVIRGATSATVPVGPAPPTVNVNEVEVHDEPRAPEGYRRRATSVGPILGAERLGASVYEMDPGDATAPYHYEGVEEEWLVVLSGTPMPRDPDGEHPLATGDLVCFPIGPDGAHKVINRSDSAARVLILATQPANDVSICVYPDSEKVGVWPWPAMRLRITEPLDYWDGEA
jgi:uncharacterized cupin superfamily protein